MNEIRKYVARNIKLKDKYYVLTKEGNKISTIRFGYVLLADVFLDLIFDTQPPLKIVIKKIDYGKTFGTISKDDAINDGYSSLAELKSDIKKYYPTIQDTSPITIIYFRLE